MFKKNILLLIGSIILALFIIEMGFRLIGPKYYRFNDASQEYYVNARGYYDLLYLERGNDPVYGLRYIEDESKYRIPSKNYKFDNSYQNENKLILGIGDSFTYGRGVRYEDIYLSKLEYFLNENKENRKFGILNKGKVGLNLARNKDSIFDIFSSEIDKFNYSFVIYGFVLNDFGLTIEHGIYGQDLIDQNNGGYKYNIWRKRLAIYNFIMNSIDMRRISKETINGYLKAFEDAEDKFEIIKEMDQISKSKDSKFILVIFPLLWNLEENYPFLEIHEKLNNFAQKNNILVLDLYSYFKDYRTEELWAAPTDHHPNEIGHEIAAKALYEFIGDMNDGI